MWQHLKSSRCKLYIVKLLLSASCHLMVMGVWVDLHCKTFKFPFVLLPESKYFS